MRIFGRVHRSNVQQTQQTPNPQEIGQTRISPGHGTETPDESQGDNLRGRKATNLSRLGFPDTGPFRNP